MRIARAQADKGDLAGAIDSIANKRKAGEGGINDFFSH